MFQTGIIQSDGRKPEEVCGETSREAAGGTEEDSGEGDGDTQAEPDLLGGEEVQVSGCKEGNEFYARYEE